VGGQGLVAVTRRLPLAVIVAQAAWLVRERRRARAARQRVVMVLENMSDEFFAVDREWRYTYVNARAIGQLGRALGRQLSADYFLGRNCWELLPQIAGTPFDSEFRRAMREQAVVEWEAFSPHTARWLEVRAFPLERGLWVFSRDIAERKRAADEHQVLVSLLDNEEDGVIATDADDFRVTAWNKGAERIYGFAAEEVLGRPAREVASSPDDRSRLRLERELSETGRTRIEFTARRKDGSAVEVELIAVAVKGEGDEIRGYLGIHRDITLRKRVEERLDEAREAERSRIARALHDQALRTLTDALALAIMAGASPGSETAGQLVPALTRVGEELRSAIYDLRLAADQPFPQLLGELVEVHREMAIDCEIELHRDDGVATGSLGAAGVEALRIVGEALTNARRHAHARHVHVRTWGTPAELHVEVADDGRGFDPTRPVSAGHRGVAGMRERAELLGGLLEIHSEPGVGTTVRLEVSINDEASGRV